jgi:transcriptional antiterminator RfaH
MPGSLLTDESGRDRIALGLLTSVESDGARSQLRIAADLGVSLGLVDAYLKRVIKKGYGEGQPGASSQASAARTGSNMIAAEPVSRWCVVQTHVGAGAKAAANLDRQGFAVYLPRCLKRRSQPSRVDTVGRGLFPRYLFVALDFSAQRWRDIQSTLGVSHLVWWGGQPASVEPGVSRAREDGCGLIILGRRATFVPGDRARIVEGAFIHNLALVVKASATPTNSYSA